MLGVLIRYSMYVVSLMAAVSRIKDPLLHATGFQLYTVRRRKRKGRRHVWAWKKIVDGSMFYEKGIWLHSRLLAAHKTQMIIFTFE
jgi:hypothetical protein